jgi:hypothetical protein
MTPTKFNELNPGRSLAGCVRVIGIFAVCCTVAWGAPLDPRGASEQQPELLRSLRDVFAVAVPESYPPLDLRIFVKHAHAIPPVTAVSLGEAFSWEPGEAGAVDVDSSNDTEFDDFAARVTDGIDEVIGWGILLDGYDDFFVPMSESFWFYPTADLAGNRLAFLRLNIRDIHIVQASFDYLYVDAAYEFWGRAIPEPGAWTTLLLGTLFIMHILPETRVHRAKR